MIIVNIELSTLRSRISSSSSSHSPFKSFLHPNNLPDHADHHHHHHRHCHHPHHRHHCDDPIWKGGMWPLCRAHRLCGRCVQAHKVFSNATHTSIFVFCLDNNLFQFFEIISHFNRNMHCTAIKMHNSRKHYNRYSAVLLQSLKMPIFVRWTIPNLLSWHLCQTNLIKKTTFLLQKLLSNIINANTDVLDESLSNPCFVHHHLIQSIPSCFLVLDYL